MKAIMNPIPLPIAMRNERTNTDSDSAKTHLILMIFLDYYTFADRLAVLISSSDGFVAPLIEIGSEADVVQLDMRIEGRTAGAPAPASSPEPGAGDDHRRSPATPARRPVRRATHQVVRAEPLRAAVERVLCPPAS